MMPLLCRRLPSEEAHLRKDGGAASLWVRLRTGRLGTTHRVAWTNRKETLVETSEKLVRFGRVLDVVGKVLAGICLLAAFCMLILVVILLLIPEETIYELLSSFRLTSNLGIFQAGTSLGDFITSATLTGIKITLIIAVLGAFAYSVLSGIILFIVSAVFKSTATKHSPFLPENVKRLKIVGVILIVATLLLGWTSLIPAFCILALAYVFQYGTELQRQADETL
jgi:hypothetical protein